MAVQKPVLFLLIMICTVVVIANQCGKRAVSPREKKVIDGISKQKDEVKKNQENVKALFDRIAAEIAIQRSTCSVSECSSYSLDKQADRSITHATVGASYKCDNALVTGWYRFNSTAGSKMPTYCVPPNKCNTHATGWLNGAHPTPQDGVVRKTVCFNWMGNCCNWQLLIKVRNCGLFYVYRLEKPPNCQLRFCVTK